MVSFILGMFLGAFFGIIFFALMQASRLKEEVSRGTGSTALADQDLERVSTNPAV